MPLPPRAEGRHINDACMSSWKQGVRWHSIPNMEITIQQQDQDYGLKVTGPCCCEE